ncbi:MAG: M23 family metallopeptidase [Pseudomonadota bacterium]
MKRLRMWTAACVLVGMASSAVADTITNGQKMAEAFMRGDVQTVWSASTDEMRAAFVSMDQMRALRENFLAQFGTEAAVLSERALQQHGYDVYARLSRWSGADQLTEVIISFDDAERVAGFLVRPTPDAAPSAHLDYRTKARLRLPVEGAWYVYWGGRAIEDNYHAADEGQRFAIDLLVRADGKSYAGDPSLLESYFCWGEPILAPAAGVVVSVVDGLPDQPIGSTDPQRPAGNHVVMDFGDGEYGFFAHFRRGSVRVSAGEEVSAGAEIGLCGNSGNTSEPHLHFHLQTTPHLGSGEGLPAQFIDYEANGVPVARGEPKRAETVKQRD